MFLKSLLKSKSVTTALHHEIANLYENLESSSALNKCHPDRGTPPRAYTCSCMQIWVDAWLCLLVCMCFLCCPINNDHIKIIYK